MDIKKQVVQFVALGMSFFLFSSISNATADLNPVEIDVPTAQANYLDYLNDIKDGKIKLPIKKLEEIDISREEVLKKYDHAIKMVNNYMKDNQILIKNDIDNADYQMFVIRACFKTRFRPTISIKSSSKPNKRSSRNAEKAFRNAWRLHGIASVD